MNQSTSYINHLKIISMNCEELIWKMNNKDNDLEMLNELIFENESNTLDVLSKTENFFRLNENPKIFTFLQSLKMIYWFKIKSWCDKLII